MLNMYNHTLNLFGLTDMESRVRNFILDRAVSLLQSLKSKRLPKTFDDIESGLLDASHTVPTNNGQQYCPGCRRSRDMIGVLVRENTQITSSLSVAPIEPGTNQQPRFTEGPARFITANDGPRDCMALLITDTLFAKLRDLHQDSHHLLRKQEQVDDARGKCRDYETLIRHIKETTEIAGSQAETVEIRDTVRQHERRLLKLRQWKDELDDRVKQLEGRINSAKSRIQWALHNAMQEADLFEPHRPLTPFTMTDTEIESRTQKDNHHESRNEDSSIIDTVTNGLGYTAHQSALPEDSDVAPEELQSIREKAWQSYNEALVTMYKVQSLFDNRQHSYETDLAEYQQGYAKGIYNISRSEFDRSKIRYGMNVTRVLIAPRFATE